MEAQAVSKRGPEFSRLESRALCLYRIEWPSEQPLPDNNWYGAERPGA